jgi:transposase InsO family protein
MMSLARLIIEAHTTGRMNKSAIAREYGISRYWVQQVVRRYEAEGEVAFQPRSRRPHSSPHAVSPEVEDQIIALRKKLQGKGLDAGAETIAAHLARRTPRSGQSQPTAPAVSTIWRVLSRRGFITPQPHKRPRSSWKTFEADQPNERWQTDTTHWQLRNQAGRITAAVEILNIIDDHARLNIGSDAYASTTAPDVVRSFRKAFRRHGEPASVLSDNGAIFTGTPRRGGRVALEIELGALGIRFNHSRAYHPQTCGKVERFHQTQKKWLAAQPPASTLPELQRQLDRFRRYYNTERPHRALQRRAPAQAYAARPKAVPTGPIIDRHYRVRADKIDKGGTITLRYNSRMHHIGLGARLAGTPVTVLVDDLHVTVLHRRTGELIRDLTLDPTRDFQPRGLPPGPPKGTPRNDP